jgi:hypothetical protein
MAALTLKLSKAPKHQRTWDEVRIPTEWNTMAALETMGLQLVADANTTKNKLDLQYFQDLRHIKFIQQGNRTHAKMQSATIT